MKLNVAKRSTVLTHEGAPAKVINAEQALHRSVMSCLLWESEAYEDGQEISKRIVELAERVSPAKLAEIAIEARKVHHLRHVPLLLVSVLCKTGAGSRVVQDTVYEVVSRADELAELLVIYWKDGRGPISNQLRKGLKRAYTKFSAYNLGKYNRDGAIKLRDVMFMVHPKPGEGQEETFKKLAEKTLESPDTWEVALSGGADKKETFERLIREESIGYLALLRNLRGMIEAGVDAGLIREAILARKGAEKVLPFRFIAAARACPQMEPYLDRALGACISDMPALDGDTAILVDVSGSMDAKLSGKSDLTRADAAAALASIINGSVRVFSFSNHVVEVPPRKGMAGVDAILKSQSHSGTDLGGAVSLINRQVKCDRLIVISDEQSQSAVPDPVAKKAYMINVASAQNGIGYGP
jgi:60 kDa SS-A/Ro ribonucleoprotein